MADIPYRWAESLTDDRLALDLHLLAENVRLYTAAERKALLWEAARRIGRTDASGAYRHESDGADQ